MASRPRIRDDVQFTEDMRRHFRDCYPVLLDGALADADEPGFLIRQARQTLGGGEDRFGMMPADILREVLGTVQATPRPSTKAGLVAISPKRARVWWDTHAVDDLDDILANLDKPRMVLRFYDITGLGSDSGKWNSVFDIDVDPAEGGKTIDFWSADRAYLVDLGIAHADGRFTRLARTNAATLPRDCGGDEARTSAMSTITLAVDVQAESILPDAAAHEWADTRRDRPDRDIEAELLINMLYRAFLVDGPRILRRTPAIHPRDSLVLEREYAMRGRQRRKRLVTGLRHNAAPALMATRLDAARPIRLAPIMLPPVVQPVPLAAALAVSRPASAALLHQAVAFTLGGFTPAPSRPAPLAITGGEYDSRSNTAEQSERAVASTGMADAGLAALASPVFEAAATLRRRIADMQPLPRIAASAELARRSSEASPHRLARAGVRITRLSLTLEGRMCPGTRMKVAGKLVRADADGHFQLKCVLSGRRSAVPVSVSNPGRQASKSVININWNERTPGEKRKPALSHH